MAENINVVVCTNSRNGSEWFGRLLVKRGFMKMREDYNPFHQVNNPSYSFNKEFVRWGHVSAVRKNRDFVTKVMPWHFVWWGTNDYGYHAADTGRRYAAENISWNNFLDCLPYEKTAFIRLIRKDSFAVARSQLGAQKVKNWQVSTQEVISADEVTDKEIKWVELNNAWWDFILTEPHVVYYEDLKENTKEEMDKVVGYIDWIRKR